MEDACHILKRKKRKTRRCLNEIRKKSRRSTDSANKNTEFGNKLKNNPTKMVGSSSHNNFITSNRLTLSIFPKAVRSETITRPLLAEIRHEPGNINLNNIIRNKYALNPESKINEKVVETQTNKALNNSVNMFSEEDSESSTKENCINSVIFRMECASDGMNDYDVGSVDGPSPSLAGGSPLELADPPSPAPRYQQEYAYNRYRQFIKEIPMYIQTHAPTLLSEDPMKKSRALLQNLYIDGWRRLMENERLASQALSTSNSSTVSMREPILENAMDYLKCCSAIASPNMPMRSPSISDSPSSSRPPSPRERPNIIQDTPEYTFFPHKLNQ